MGCKGSRPSKRQENRPIYISPEDDSPQLKNSLKQPGSARKNASVRFATNDEIFNVEDIKQHNLEKPIHGNINEYEDEVDKKKQENNEAVQSKLGLEKVCEFVEVYERKSVPQPTSTIPPSQLQEESQVMNVNSLPVTSAKSQELIVTKRKLNDTESAIIQKEEQIRKLIGENERLKNEASKHKELEGIRLQSRIGSQDPLLRPKSKQSTMRERIKELKNGTSSGFVSNRSVTTDSGSSMPILESPSRFVATSGTAESTEVCDEPLSFRTGVAEAKTRATNTDQQKEKPPNNDWEISEFIVL